MEYFLPFLPDLFLKVLNMSITASLVMIFVMAARLLLKKAPKIFSYSLWSVVLFRLICPFSFTSAFSFLKVFFHGSRSMDHIPNQIGMMAQPRMETGPDQVNAMINGSLPAAAVPYSGANPMEMIMFALSLIWVIGMMILVVYGVSSYFLLKRKVSTGMLLKDNVFESEKIAAPFVLGIIRPRIYLPLGLSETEKSFILKHEQTHIRRFDYIIKPFAFLVLCIHWFNPIVWISFVLMSRDMEMSCDEQVIKELGTEIKKDYSASLLSLAVNRGMISGSPLSFGETGVKGRITNVLNYRRPALWVIVAAIILVAAMVIGLSGNPDAITDNEGKKMQLAETWAESLRTRDGKPRYEIMSESMKEKFVAGQIQRAGDDWNYNIGGSSPWVESFTIDVEGNTANITYHLADSGGGKYEQTEIITFGREDNRLVVIDAREQIAEWERVNSFAPTALQAAQDYIKALKESNYLSILSWSHDHPFDPMGQEIWDTVKIRDVKIIQEDVRENKACFWLEMDIEEGGTSAFEKGVSPRWLWLVKGEHGWYVEGLMTGGPPTDNWYLTGNQPAKEISIADLTEKSIITSDRFEFTDYPLIAELPQEDIYLYGMKPTGVVLKYGDDMQLFNWIYTTPRFILPVLNKQDLDHDGRDEIVCVLNVNSGTGVAIDELHVLKQAGTPGYIDYIFSDYLEQMKTMLSADYDKKENSILLKTNNKSYTYDMPAGYEEYTFKNIAYGNIVYFEAENGLKIKVPIGLAFEEMAEPQFFGDTPIFAGDIVFRNGKFQITNPEITIE
ncbi:M56 family metallopeptidase [Dehalobacterium formicoaceticum]|uniref:M56 family metallopeptidase n=1 Tax=Dehalobacterium formicoaceticum TaxID=51515 RepID=UPI0031F6B135